MKKLLSFIFVILLTCSVACSDKSTKSPLSSTTPNNPAENKTEENNDTNTPSENSGAVEGASITFDGEIQNMTEAEIVSVVKEVLGEMIFTEINLDDLLEGDGIGSKSLVSKSVNADFEAKASYIDKEYNIASYPGSAHISTEGALEEVVSGSEASVYYFSPLYLTIEFENYEVSNDEINELIVNGSISCFFKGRLEVGAGMLIGNGGCHSGTYEEIAPLAIEVDGISHSVKHMVSFKTMGPVFDVDEMDFSGEFKIDGIKVNLGYALQ